MTFDISLGQKHSNFSLYMHSRSWVHRYIHLHSYHIVKHIEHLSWNSISVNGPLIKHEIIRFQLSTDTFRILILLFLFPQKRKGDAYSNSGTIKVDHFEIRKINSFMDYIKGGVQLHCSIAIDFTGMLTAH